MRRDCIRYSCYNRTPQMRRSLSLSPSFSLFSFPVERETKREREREREIEREHRTPCLANVGTRASIWAPDTNNKVIA